MKFVVLITLFAVVFGYSDIDNRFDYATVIKDLPELRHHLYCFLDKEPCNDIAAHYKVHILDSLLDTCGHCTSMHKHNARVFLRAIKANIPEGYEEMRQKFDPEDKFFTTFEKVVANY